MEAMQIISYRQFTEFEYNIVWIVGVTNSISTSQQHLEWYVGYEITHFLQTFPWTFVQETQGNIKSGTTPIFQGIQIVKFVGHKRRYVQEIVRAYTCGQQRLMGISVGGVHQQEILA